MTLDIKAGDILVVDTAEYPIRAVAEYKTARMSRSTFARIATETATTKRSPGIVDGKRGDPVENLVDLTCTPLDPVDPEVRQRLGLNTPHEVLETYLDHADGFMQIIVEELKR